MSLRRSPGERSDSELAWSAAPVPAKHRTQEPVAPRTGRAPHPATVVIEPSDSVTRARVRTPPSPVTRVLGHWNWETIRFGRVAWLGQVRDSGLHRTQTGALVREASRRDGALVQNPRRKNAGSDRPALRECVRRSPSLTGLLIFGTERPDLVSNLYGGLRARREDSRLRRAGSPSYNEDQSPKDIFNSPSRDGLPRTGSRSADPLRVPPRDCPSDGIDRKLLPHRRLQRDIARRRSTAL